MAKEISKLFVTLGIDSTQFKSELKRVDKETKALGKAFVGIGAGMVAAISGATYAWAKAGDEIDKMRQRTGWAAESLSELKYVAEMNGAGLNDMELAIRRVSRAYVDAERGGASYAKSLREIGISTEDLQSLSQEERFFAVAGAIADVDDAARKTALAYELFGDSGTRLLPMLESGSDGIEKLIKEAHDLGIIFDEEAARSAAELSDSITTLKASFQGLANEVGSNVAPTFTAYSEMLTNATKSVGQFSRDHEELSFALTNGALSFGASATAAGGLLLILPKVLQIAGSLKIGMLALSGAVAGFTAGITLIGTGISMLIQNHQRYEAMQEAGLKLTQENEKYVRGEANAWEEAAIEYADYLELYVKHSGLSRERKTELIAEAKATRDFAQASLERKRWIEETTTAIEANWKAADDLITTYKESQTEAAKWGITIQDITGYLVEAGRESELFKLQWDDIGQSAPAMAAALGVEVEKVAAWTGKLKGETDSLLSSVQSIIAQLNYERSAAGELGITYQDMVGVMYDLGFTTEGITLFLSELGDEAENVNAILGKLHLTAGDVADLQGGQAGRSQLLRDLFEGANLRGENFTPYFNIPQFATGGTVPGPVGQAQLAVVHGGETVIPAGQGGGGITNNFSIASLVVREEADVQRVARELYRMQQVRR